MDHFAGLDVSVKETSVCIVDDTGKIVREVKVASEPEASSYSCGLSRADCSLAAASQGIAQRAGLSPLRQPFALRSSSEHAAVEEMVVAQGLGDADCQAPRDGAHRRQSDRTRLSSAQRPRKAPRTNGRVG